MCKLRLCRQAYKHYAKRRLCSLSARQPVSLMPIASNQPTYSRTDDGENIRLQSIGNARSPTCLSSLCSFRCVVSQIFLIPRLHPSPASPAPPHGQAVVLR